LVHAGDGFLVFGAIGGGAIEKGAASTGDGEFAGGEVVPDCGQGFE
jgi:hypothetical protein